MTEHEQKVFEQVLAWAQWAKDKPRDDRFYAQHAALLRKMGVMLAEHEHDTAFPDLLKAIVFEAYNHIGEGGA